MKKKLWPERILAAVMFAALVAAAVVVVGFSFWTLAGAIILLAALIPVLLWFVCALAALALKTCELWKELRK
jgi:hypothetical protein